MCHKAKGRKGGRKTEKSTAVVEQEAAWFSVGHRILFGGKRGGRVGKERGVREDGGEERKTKDGIDRKGKFKKSVWLTVFMCIL